MISGKRDNKYLSETIFNDIYSDFGMWHNYNISDAELADRLSKRKESKIDVPKYFKFGF